MNKLFFAFLLLAVINVSAYAQDSYVQDEAQDEAPEDTQGKLPEAVLQVLDLPTNVAVPQSPVIGTLAFYKDRAQAEPESRPFMLTSSLAAAETEILDLTLIDKTRIVTVSSASAKIDVFEYTLAGDARNSLEITYGTGPFFLKSGGLPDPEGRRPQITIFSERAEIGHMRGSVLIAPFEGAMHIYVPEGESRVTTRRGMFVIDAGEYVRIDEELRRPPRAEDMTEERLAALKDLFPETMREDLFPLAVSTIETEETAEGAENATETQEAVEDAEDENTPEEPAAPTSAFGEERAPPSIPPPSAF